MRKKIILLISILLVLLAGSCIYYFSNYDSNLIEPNKIETDTKYKNITYDIEENILNEDILGMIEIEKIGLKAPVKEGNDNKVLKEYIGHITNTSMYDGNIGLAAHNRGNKYSYFARINELKNGDIITYKTNFYTRKYKVNNIQTIFETDWSLLGNSKENRLTLITCIANKKNQRLCVQAMEVLENDL